MSRLSEKQRRFAAGIAAGMSVDEALACAGYDARQRWRGARNLVNAQVLSLVAFLREGMARHAPDDEHGAADGAVSRERVTRMLHDDRRLAYRVGAASAAVTASLAIARINGLIVERRPLEAHPLSEMSDDELMSHLRALSRATRRVLTVDVVADEAPLPAPRGGEAEE